MRPVVETRVTRKNTNATRKNTFAQSCKKVKNTDFRGFWGSRERVPGTTETGAACGSGGSERTWKTGSGGVEKRVQNGQKCLISMFLRSRVGDPGWRGPQSLENEMGRAALASWDPKKASSGSSGG